MPAIETDASSALLIASGAQAVLCLLGLSIQWNYWRRRHAPTRLARWPVRGEDFGLCALLTMVTAVIVQTVLVQMFGGLNDTLWQLLVPGGGFQIGVLLGALISVLWLQRARGKLAAAEAGAHLVAGTAVPPPARRPWLEGVRVFAAIVPVTIGASFLWLSGLDALGIDAPQQELIELFAKADAPGPFFALTFVAVLLAPLTEEIVFRAGLFRFLRDRLPRWIALLLPAMVFAALHANLASFLPLFLLGVFFALAYEYTGRLIVPVTAHALFNLNTILLVLCGAGQ